MKQNQEFEWSAYKNDKERIQAYSNKFRDMSITDAFASVYDINITNPPLSANVPPVEDLKIGDTVSAKIIDISKNKVEFDTSRFKGTVFSNCNLYKYDKFKHFIPKDTLKLKVINKVKDRVVVDVLQPMLEDYILPRVDAPWIQKNVSGPCAIRVKNLQLTSGGFMGKAVIPNISDFVGQDYEVDAFIPGSQIVLNITKDFDSFVGQDVYALIINYVKLPYSDKMVLVCSVKEYLKTWGEINMIYLFKQWTENNEDWKKLSEMPLNGVVTGVINNSKRFADAKSSINPMMKRAGVFVEIPDYNITGMVNIEPDQLKKYRAGDNVQVRIDGFEEMLKYNAAAQQMQHIDPYIIEDGRIKKCNLKPILKFC